MKELLKNWEMKLKELKQYKERLVNEYCKTQREPTKIDICMVNNQIKILETCVKLEKFELKDKKN